MSRRVLTLLTLAAAFLSVGPAHALDPKTFAEVSSGVGRIHVYSCNGRLMGQGTGFLIGTKLMMTAKHVVAGGCSAKVFMGRDVYQIKRQVFWRTSRHSRDTDIVDVATLVLSKPARSHFVFSFAKKLPGLKSTVASIGFPAGNPLSLSQGRYLGTRKIRGVPTLGVRLHTATGSSGSALLNTSGNVLGILQQGYADTSGGIVVGINLVKWWPGIEDDLCRAHPSAGVPTCEPPVPPGADSLTFTVDVPVWQESTTVTLRALKVGRAVDIVIQPIGQYFDDGPISYWTDPYGLPAGLSLDKDGWIRGTPKRAFNGTVEVFISLEGAGRQIYLKLKLKITK